MDLAAWNRDYTPDAKPTHFATAIVILCVLMWGLGYAKFARAKSTAYINPSHDNPAQELMRLRTEGVAHFESGIAQKKALASFAAALQIEGAGAIDHFNHGVILKKLNKNSDAKDALTKAIASDAKLAHPHYALGLIHLGEENNAAALSAFRRAAKLAPNESSTHYQLSRLYREMNDKTKALQAIVETLRLDPYHTGALYQLYLHHQQTGDREKAQQIFQEFSRLKKAIGKTRKEVNPDESHLAKPINGDRQVAGLPFEANAGTISFNVGSAIIDKAIGSFAIADIDQDQRQDIVVADRDGKLAIWAYKAANKFKLLKKIGDLGQIEGIELAKLQRAEPYSILLKTRTGLKKLPLLDANAKPKDPKAKQHKASSKAPEKIEIKFGELEALTDEPVSSMLLADIDHDGDTDIVLDNFRTVLMNRGDAKFDRNDQYLPSTEVGKLGASTHPIVGSDLRSQIAVDFVAVANNATRYVLRDDMGGAYSVVDGLLQELPKLFWHAMADMDNDGHMDVVSLTNSGLIVDYNQGNLHFNPQKSPQDIPLLNDALVIDINNDGYKDIAYAVPDSGIHVFLNRGERRFSVVENSVASDDFSRLAAIDANSDGVLDIVALNAQENLVVLENTTDTDGAHWIALSLEGIRSAPDGRYTQVEVRYGSYYAKYQARGGLLHVPLGQAPHAELIRISWPNGFVENKFTIEPKKTWYFAESERISGSCPSIYAWNGEQYVYITDAFISGPMGVPTSPGRYFPVGDDEYVKIPGRHLKKDAQGNYRVSIVEELREVTYLDEVRLYAVDTPNTYYMFPNEYLMPPEFPQFKLHLSASAEPPVQALDHHGNDVTALVAEVDYTYPHHFNRADYTGFADTNAVEIFLTDEQRRAEHLRVFLTGWFYYFDSTSIIAAAQQPEMDLIWPQVQVLRSGKWEFLQRIGIPSGKEKTVVVDLSGRLPEDAEKIRVVTNLEMYWDRILIDAAPPPVATAARVHALDTSSTRLRLHGFSRLLRPPGEFPMPDRFDYHQRSYRSLWDPLAGRYTRYGQVDELIGKVDGKMAVFSSGDELSLRFDGSQLPPVAPGQKRDFLIYLNGYVKDGDKYTAHAGTVEPMPFQGMRSYPYSQAERDAVAIDEKEYRKYLEEYQTRGPLRFTGPGSERINF